MAPVKRIKSSSPEQNRSELRDAPLVGATTDHNNAPATATRVDGDPDTAPSSQVFSETFLLDVVKKALAAAQVCPPAQCDDIRPGDSVPATGDDGVRPGPSGMCGDVGMDYDSDGPFSDVSGDAFAGLSMAGSEPAGQDDCEDVDVELEASILDWQESFMRDNVLGAPVNQSIADVVNDSLRVRPKDDVIKLEAAGIHAPSNVPNLVVPVTNSDIEQALSRGTKILDGQLSRSTDVLAKGMVPLLRLASDMKDETVKLGPGHCKGVLSSLKLLTAAFNYLNHSRKELIRNSVQNEVLRQLCSWKCKVGDKELFPFDVNKKVAELRKGQNLGRLKSYREFKRYDRTFRGGSRRPGFYNMRRFNYNYGTSSRNNFRGFPKRGGYPRQK